MKTSSTHTILIFVCTLFLATAGLAQDTTTTDPAAGLSGILRYYTLAGAAEAQGDFAGTKQHLLDGLDLIPSSPPRDLAWPEPTSPSVTPQLVLRLSKVLPPSVPRST